MKQILIFGAGKSAGVLIRTLLDAAPASDLHLTIVDIDLELAQSRIGNSLSGTALSFPVTDGEQRAAAIRSADLVISLMPPALHILIARDCLQEGKNLLTASYVDKEMASLHEEVAGRGLLFLCETGLDPGIDHMSALRLIGEIKAKGGDICSFMSHCGGLMAPESDDNPWHYKVSWNPANIVQAGRDGAKFYENGRLLELNRVDLFSGKSLLEFPGYGEWSYYPNRDSTAYRSLYKLDSADTFLRTTLRHPAFMRAWLAIIQSGLIDSSPVGGSFADWAGTAIKPWVNADNEKALAFLGLFSEMPVPAGLKNGAAVLQHLLETKLAMQEQDKDLVLMMHEIKYSVGKENRLARSYFSLEGKDAIRTAMATTVGLPLARAAELMLGKGFGISGVHVPVLPEIYEPLLSRLESDGIIFTETDERITD